MDFGAFIKRNYFCANIVIALACLPAMLYAQTYTVSGAAPGTITPGFPTPGVGTTVNPPLPATPLPGTQLLSGDVVTIASGATMATPSTSAIQYTIGVNTTAPPGPSLTINVNSGGTLSYSGSNGSGAAIFVSRNDNTLTTQNMNIDGTISSGTGLYAASLTNIVGVTAQDTYNINISGTASVSGTIVTSGVLHSAVNITGTPTINGAIILGVSSIGSSALVVGASGTATFTPTYSISTIDSVQISNNSTFNLGVTNSDLRSILIDSGSTLTNSITINGTSTADGNIVNNGTFNIGAPIAKTGTFTGTGTNVVTAGSAAGISITTSNYRITNHRAALLDVQNYGNITLSTGNFNLNNGGANTFSIAYGTASGYSPGYFPEGTYTLVTTTLGTITAPTFSAVPASTLFLSFGTPFVSGNTIKVTLTRTGFNEYPGTDLTQSIAGSLEAIGNNSPNSSALTLLNAMEATTSVASLQSNLQQLAPLTTAPIFGYQIQNDSMRQAKLRLAELRDHNGSYFAGDIGKDAHLWLRPFGAYANQDAKEDSLGYYARSGGIIVGFDRNLDDYYTLGAAFAYVNSNVQDKINTLSITNLQSYIGMLYGTYNLSSSRYVDWVLAITANNFDANRLINFNSFNQFASSSYSSQQFAINGIIGEDYEAFGFLELTPEAFGQLTYAKQYPYTETNGGGANLNIDRYNPTIVTLGLGAKAAMPLLADPSIIVPELHTMFFYTPFTGNQDTIFSFVEGGSPLTSSFSLSRTGLLIGAAFTVAVVDKLELKFNFDYDIEDRYHGYTAWLNLRYVF